MLVMPFPKYWTLSELFHTFDDHTFGIACFECQHVSKSIARL